MSLFSFFNKGSTEYQAVLAEIRLISQELKNHSYGCINVADEVTKLAIQQLEPYKEKGSDILKISDNRPQTFAYYCFVIALEHELTCGKFVIGVGLYPTGKLSMLGDAYMACYSTLLRKMVNLNIYTEEISHSRYQYVRDRIKSQC